MILILIIINIHQTSNIKHQTSNTIQFHSISEPKHPSLPPSLSPSQRKKKTYLPHPPITIPRKILFPSSRILHSARDALPTGSRTHHVPFSRVVDLAAHENGTGSVAEGARFVMRVRVIFVVSGRRHFLFLFLVLFLFYCFILFLVFLMRCWLVGSVY